MALGHLRSTEFMSINAFTVCVFCGSRSGGNTDYEAAARSMGQAIGRRGMQLVYGGGNVGLMGIVADAALQAGARVVGVIPDSLMRREVGHRGLSELHVVPNMHVRKRMMAERADAFVALPGGIGTFEELFEVWTWRQLRYHDRPIGLLDVANYYTPLLTFLRNSVDEGFLDADQLASLYVDTQPGDLLDTLVAAPAGERLQLDRS